MFKITIITSAELNPEKPIKEEIIRILETEEYREIRIQSKKEFPTYGTVF